MHALKVIFKTPNSCRRS